MAVPARDRRRVFLVHGQDAERADHLRKLVIYAGALVVEWEEAVEWTGKGTPTTLEVIVGALDRVQAVLVLFSPDENVSLRAELGGGQEGFQPRPNVYVEAGMALAVAPERTVIVEFGTSRAASDLAPICPRRCPRRSFRNSRLLDTMLDGRAVSCRVGTRSNDNDAFTDAAFALQELGSRSP